MADRQPPQSFSYAAGEAFVLQFDVDQVITLATVRFSARRSLMAEPVLSTDDSSALANITGAQQFTIAVRDEATEGLLGTYRYSAEVEDVGGDKSEVAWGFLTFHERMISDASS